MKSIIPFIIIGVVCFALAIAVFNIRSHQETPDSFYESQTAMVNGQILKISGQAILLKNKQNQTRWLSLSDNFAVVKSTQPGVPTVSSKLEDIELNQNVGVALKMVAGKYLVTTLNFGPAAVLLEPTPSYMPGSPQSFATASGKILPPPSLPSPPNYPPGTNFAK